jgi:ribosomal protein L11 methyltransferase
LRDALDWIRATLHTDPQKADDVLGVLLMHGITSAQIFDDAAFRQELLDNPAAWDYADEALLSVGDDAPVRIEFYASADEQGADTLAQINAALLSQFDTEAVCETVSDQTWLHEWKKHFKPLRMSERVVVVPSWEAYTPQKDDLTVYIDPGSVFGTGQHQSTRLCVRLMEAYLQPGHSLFDIGCGSGILSVVGLLMGAGRVVACDLDPAAHASVMENLARNPVDVSLSTMHTGDIFCDEPLLSACRRHPFDIAVANIVADPVIRLSGMAGDFLKPGGIFIASGIIPERVDEVTQALRANGLTLLQTIEKDGWYAVASQYHG